MDERSIRTLLSDDVCRPIAITLCFDVDEERGGLQGKNTECPV
jgi:hypothetical protein